jgi:transcriptional regulator with XRE-family HTH domain
VVPQDIGNVVEFLGRPSRQSIATLVKAECDKIADKIKAKRKGRGLHRLTGRKVMADKLGVSVLSIDAWLRRGDYQASNSVMTRMIKLALELNESQTNKIIRQSLANFEQRFKDLVKQW